MDEIEARSRLASVLDRGKEQSPFVRLLDIDQATLETAATILGERGAFSCGLPLCSLEGKGRLERA
jgi:hypothetical protein